MMPAPMDRGWRIDPDTLLPEITDAVTFRESLADDPCRDVLAELWSGYPQDALRLVTAMLVGDPASPRLLALRADCLRDCGRFEEAQQDLEDLVAAHAGTKREAVLVQHLGKALFAAGRFDEAAGCFARALRLREQSGSDADLIASARMALDRARQLAQASGGIAPRVDPG